MKLSMLSDVLFDEFPNDESIKYCFFTQPKHTDVDYSVYKDKVTFCCNKATVLVMTSSKNLPSYLFSELTEEEVIFESHIKFGIRCVSSGDVSGSSMLIIGIGDNFHLYTGRFTQYREAIFSPTILQLKSKITDIHIDNTTASLRDSKILQKARDEIKQIVNDNVGFKIYLHTEVYGYEELLCGLAQEEIKIRLNELQKVQFDHCELGEWFQFDGTPQIEVCVSVSAEHPFTQSDYEQFYNDGMIHIYLSLKKHNRDKNFINGLFYVHYTPHPTTQTLHNVIELLQPKRVHPLLPQTYTDDPLTVIPMEILNEGCVIDSPHMAEMNRMHDECLTAHFEMADINTPEEADFDRSEEADSNTSEEIDINAPEEFTNGQKERNVSFLKFSKEVSGELSSDISDILSEPWSSEEW